MIKRLLQADDDGDDDEQERSVDCFFISIHFFLRWFSGLALC